MERNLKNGLSEQVEWLQHEFVEVSKSKEDCERLIACSENDLQRAISQATPTLTQTKHQHKLDMVSQLSIDDKNSSATLQHILDPSIPPPPPPGMSTPATSKVTSEKADDDHSVATIVMAQRDRLRVRCDALEAERDSFKRELQYQVQTLESLKSDNTKLYEKVRYLQNYNSTKGNTLSSGNSGGLNQRTVVMGSGDRDLDLEALEQRYEASVDPFKQFSKSERQRKLNEMSPMERAVFVVARTVLCTYPEF
jgi:homeobox protein cut-like